jgi:hypothetical protein
MTHPSVEQPSPGPWEEYHSFRLRLPADPDDEEGRAAEAGLHEAICRGLGDNSCEFGFTPDGVLRLRDRDDRPNVATSRPGPARVYNTVRDVLLGTGLTPPPPEYQPLAEPDLPDRTVDDHQGMARSRLGRVFGSLGLRLGPRPPRPQVDYQAAWERGQQHDRGQFAKLREWFEQQLVGGSALAVLKHWHLRRLEEQQSPGQGVTVPRGGEKDSGYALVRVNQAGDGAWLEFRAVPPGARLRLAVVLDGWHVEWEDQHPPSTSPPTVR